MSIRARRLVANGTNYNASFPRFGRTAIGNCSNQSNIGRRTWLNLSRTFSRLHRPGALSISPGSTGAAPSSRRRRRHQRYANFMPFVTRFRVNRYGPKTGVKSIRYPNGATI